MTTFSLEPGGLVARRYEIVRALQAADDGGVCLARDLRGEHGDAVLKIAFGRDAGRPRAVRIEREFRLLSAFHHPGTPRALDFGRDVANDVTWMLREYVAGETFDKRGILAPSQATHFLADVLRVLAAAHDHGVVHGDLKPANLVFDEASGRTMALDWDLATPMRSTARGGSPPFAAPEAVRGRFVDGRSDLWSLAATFRVLAGGEPPDADGSVSGPPFAAGTPLGVFLDSALAIDPESRPADARAALALLRRAGFEAPDETPATLKARLSRPPIFGDEQAQRLVFNDVPAGRVRTGGASAVVVRGGFGSGKTRLLEGLVAEWHAADVRTVLIRGAEEAGRGLRPIAKLLRAVDDSCDDEAMTAALRRPGGADRLAGRLFEAARARRTVMVLDDAERLDRAARDVIAQMVRRMIDETASGDGAIAQVVVAVGVDAPPDDPLTKFVAGESESGGILTVEPDRLQPADLERLTRVLARIADVPADAAVARVQFWGAATPWAAIETVAAMRDGDDGGTAPPSLEAVRARALAKLDRAETAVVAALSLFADGATPESTEIVALTLDPDVQIGFAAARLTARGLAKAPSGGRRRAADFGLAAAALSRFTEARVRAAKDAAAERCSAIDPRSSEALQLMLGGLRPREAAAVVLAAAEERMELGEAESALRLFEALRDAKDVPRFAARVATLRAFDAALAAGLFSAAEICLQGAGADPAVRVRRARLARVRGDVRAAVAEYESLEPTPLTTTSAEAADSALELAEAAFAGGDVETARAALDRAASTLGDSAPLVGPAPRDVPMHELRGPRVAWPGDDARRVAQWLTLRGELANAAGDAVETVHFLLGALKIAVRLRDVALSGRIENRIGTAYMRAGAFEPAERWLRRAAALWAEAADAKGLADTANNLGILARRRGRSSEAIEHFSRSLRLRRRLGNLVDEAGSYQNIANVYLERRELEPASRYAHRALALARRLSNHPAQARILNNLGAASFLNRRFEEALRSYEEAELLARGVGQLVDALAHRLNAAEVLLAAGDSARAERAIRVVGRIASRRGMAEIVTRSALLTGRALLRRRSFDAAARILREALAGEPPSPTAEALRFDLAAAEIERGATAEARRLLDEVAASPTVPETPLHVAVLRACAASSEGDDALRGSLSELTEAARTAERLKLPWSVFETNAVAGRAFRRLGERGRALTAYGRAFEVLEAVLRGFTDPWLLNSFCLTSEVAGFVAEVESFREEAARERPPFPAAAARDLVRRSKDALFDAERAVRGPEEGRQGGEALRRVMDVARKLSSTAPLDELLRELVDAANDFTGAERGFVVLMEERGRLRIPVARDRGREPIQDPVRQVSRRVVEDSLKRKAPVRIDNAMVDGSFNSAASVMNLELRSVMCAPLLRNGEPFGLLYVDHRSRAARFVEGDLEMLGLFAAQAAVALENARMVREFVRDEKLKLLGNLAGGVAHDFNNLLTAILGDAQAALLRAAEPAVTSSLRMIERAAQEGAAVVRRLHNFARTRRDEAFGAVELRDAVADVVEFTRTARERAALAGGGEITIRNETPPGIAALGDAVEIREVLTNVALNAVAAMPNGGVLRFGAGRDNGRVFVLVADDGVGMTEEVREGLFDPYFTTRGSDGVGLGMSIVYGIVARHHGSIVVESAPGQGTRIRVELPAADGEVPAAALRESATEGVAVVRGDSRVLVVEDDAAVRRVIAETMRHAGFRVAEAAGGPEAVRRFVQGRFDLVLSDHGMVPMNGFDVAQAIKQRDPTVTVYLVTGWGSEIDQETARRHGVDALVRKPYDAKTLVRLADEGVARTARLRAEAAATNA